MTSAAQGRQSGAGALGGGGPSEESDARAPRTRDEALDAIETMIRAVEQLGSVGLHGIAWARGIIARAGCEVEALLHRADADRDCSGFGAPGTLDGSGPSVDGSGLESEALEGGGPGEENDACSPRTVGEALGVAVTKFCEGLADDLRRHHQHDGRLDAILDDAVGSARTGQTLEPPASAAAETRLFYDLRHDIDLTEQLNMGGRTVSRGLLDRARWRLAGRARELRVRIRILAMGPAGGGETGPKVDPDDICSLQMLDLCLADAENFCVGFIPTHLFFLS